jgi:hypothetical protein
MFLICSLTSRSLFVACSIFLWYDMFRNTVKRLSFLSFFPRESEFGLKKPPFEVGG